jgi:hypothetical protein
LVRVDGEVRQGVTADGVQDSVGIARDDLDVPVEQHPVTRQRLVAVAEWMPAVMGHRVLEDRGDADRRWIRVNAGIHPLVQRPGVGGAAGHPALLANCPRGQFEGQAREGRTRFAVVDPVDAVVLPDERFHLGGRPARRYPQEVVRHVDDGCAEHRVIGGRGVS